MFQKFELIYFQYNLCAEYSLLPLPSPLSLIDVALLLLKVLAINIKDLCEKVFELIKKRKNKATSPEPNPEDPVLKSENGISLPQTSKTAIKDGIKNQNKPMFYSTNKLDEIFEHNQFARKLSDYTELALNSEYIKQIEIHY